MAWYNPFSWFEEPDTSERGYVLRAHDLNDTDPQRRAAARKAFQDNYANLYRQLDDGWRPILKEMASNSVGRSIIANMPPNVKVNNGVSFQDPSTGASYSYDTNTLNLRSVHRTNLGMYTREDGTADPVYNHLTHECRHAMQDYLGYATFSGKQSLKEAAINGMLIEADAFSFGAAENLIREAFGTSNPTQEQVKKIALTPRQELREIYLKKHADEYFGGDLNKARRDKTVDGKLKTLPEPVRRVRAALIKHGGDLNKARQELRRKEFRSRLGKNGLGVKYEKQALQNIIGLMRLGVRVGDENKALSNQIYKQIAAANGVSVGEIKKNLKVTPMFQQCLDYMAAHPNATPDELDQVVAKIFDEGLKKYDKNRDADYDEKEWKAMARPLREPDAKAGARVQVDHTVAQAEQSSGGFGSWFRSSWLGRALGFSNETPAQAPAGQDQTAIASSTETEGKAPTTQPEAERGPSDARRTLASAGQRYQDRSEVTQYQRGSGRDV